MTKNEVIRIINKFMFDETYTNKNSKPISETAATFPFDKLFDYLLKLDIPYEVMEKFVRLDSDFASLENERYEDDPDYLEITFDKDGNIVDLYCWTEVLGTVYSVKDYNKYWKEYEKTKEELKREAEFEKKWQKIITESKEEFTKFCMNLTTITSSEDMVEPKKFGINLGNFTVQTSEPISIKK